MSNRKGLGLAKPEHDEDGPSMDSIDGRDKPKPSPYPPFDPDQPDGPPRNVDRERDMAKRRYNELRQKQDRGERLTPEEQQEMDVMRRAMTDEYS